MIVSIVKFLKTTVLASSTENLDGEQFVVLCHRPPVRDLVVRWLTESGERVQVAHDAGEAHRVLSTLPRNPKSLIVDHEFFSWFGIGSIDRIKAEMPNLRIVLIQDCSFDGADMAATVGADVSIERPLNRADLLQALDLGA